MKVMTKDGAHLYDVCDIVYDKSRYPHFLIWNGNEWLMKSAKYFIPVTLG